MASSVPKVLVTGASGYIANHIIKQLLEGGKYAVRGTVRNLQNEKKVQPVRNLVPSSTIPLELVEADLLKEDTWPAAVEGCQFVLHVASPFFSGDRKIRDEKTEMIDPAVNGTTNVLKACSEAGVRRVVLTSSVAAVSAGLVGVKSHPKGIPYTDKDWTPETEGGAYIRSKTLAERAAWNFLEKLPDDKKFELVVMNPSYVLGPLLSPVSGEGSAQAISHILKGDYPAYPALNFPIVDVRDVAAAHIKGLEVPDAAGNRFILTSHNIWMTEMAKVLKAEFSSQGYKIKTGQLPKAIVWMSKFFDDSINQIYPQLDVVLEFNTEPMRTTLGIEPLPVEQSVIELAYSLIELGIVSRKPQYRGPESTDLKKPSNEPSAVAEGEPREDCDKEEEPRKESDDQMEEPQKESGDQMEEPQEEDGDKMEPEDRDNVGSTDVENTSKEDK